jgi:hypothetical protein
LFTSCQDVIRQSNFDLPEFITHNRHWVGVSLITAVARLFFLEHTKNSPELAWSWRGIRPALRFSFATTATLEQVL